MKISKEEIKRNLFAYLSEHRKWIHKKQIENIINIFNNTKNEIVINAIEIDTIGIGGNGIVFSLKTHNDEPCCLKCLYNQQDARIKRFDNEITAMKEIKNIDGILPILSDGVEEKLDFYIMPKCEKYNIFCEKSFLNRIDDLLIIARIIKNIRDNAKKVKAHRDIKIDNILLKDGKIYLSDFGLAKLDNNENITKDPIGGPRIISPPEYYDIDIAKDWDYHYSDVYLFSKVAWQIIRQEEHGFWGEYIINQNNYISNEIIEKLYYDENIITIAPINEMLINTTSNNLNHRRKYDIDYCIKKLKEEKNIIENGFGDKDSIRCKDDVNWIKFFNHGNTSIISFEPEVTSEIEKLMENEHIMKVLKYYTKDKDIKELTLTVDNADVKYESLHIELVNKNEINGKIRYIISDNMNNRIILFFENYEIDASGITKKIESYIEKGPNKYVLDNTSELMITFD